MKSSGGQTHHVTANMTKPVLCPINPVLCRSFGVERGMSRPFLTLQLPQEKKWINHPLLKFTKPKLWEKTRFLMSSLFCSRTRQQQVTSHFKASELRLFRALHSLPEFWSYIWRAFNRLLSFSTNTLTENPPPATTPAAEHFCREHRGGIWGTARGAGKAQAAGPGRSHAALCPAAPQALCLWKPSGASDLISCWSTDALSNPTRK